MSAAAIPAMVEIGKQAGIAIASQKLASEANKALGQTQGSGLQSSAFENLTGKTGSGILKAIEQQKADNVIKKAAGITSPPPIMNENYDDKLNKILGVG